MRKQHGVSLVELMIAIALGLVVVMALSLIFVNTSRSRTEMERSNRQTENGRYAVQLLADNLRMAGYLAEFDTSPLASPASLPDPCDTATADLVDALPLHVQGINDATGASTPSCLDDVKVGTDILVVRRVSVCAAGTTACAAFVEGVPHFQAALCTPSVGNTELAFPVTSNADYANHYFTLATGSGDFTKHKTDCTTAAEIYRYFVHIYFIANNNQAGDGVPTLKRAELGNGGFNIIPLVDGIQNMEIDYGVDNAGADGVADVYTQAPATVADWRNVMSARINLLARNTEPSVGHTDNRSYALGFNDDGTEVTVGPFNDAYKRHVFSETVRLANPSWRRQ